MNRSEMLFSRLASECMEVGHRISKILDFGVDNIQEGHILTNKQRLHNELNDLLAQVEMLNEEGVLDFTPDRAKIDAKKHQVEHYALISKQLGTLQDGNSKT